MRRARPSAAGQSASGGSPHVDSEQRAGDEQRVGDVVAGVAEVAVATTSSSGLAQWSRMVRMSASIWVGCQASVSPFHTGTPAERARLSTVLLVEAAVLDAVEHAAEDPGGVPDRLLAAQLGLAGPR